jgi:hypothetical protein
MACNEGTEFVRRLELAWADVIHLLVFNLTVNTSSKYHDLTKVIIPYIEDNLSILQIPKEVKVSTISYCDNYYIQVLLSVFGHVHGAPSGAHL